jgi:hypothetical protein
MKKITTPSLAPCDLETLNRIQRGNIIDATVEPMRIMVDTTATRSRA